MRRVTLSHVCALSAMVMLAGCEMLAQLWPSIIDPGAEEPQEPQEPGEPQEPQEPELPSIERASTFLVIEDERALSATTQGFRILDLRDPEHPRVESSFELASEKLELYRMGDHVILLATFPRGYEGERDDVPVRRSQSAPATLFNLDIRDRANPTLVNQLELEDLPRHSLMRRTPDEHVLFTLPLIWNGQHYQSRIDRYALRDGVLVHTAQLLLDGETHAVSATADRLLAATSGPDATDAYATATVVDITKEEPSILYTTSFAGEVDYLSQVQLHDDQLCVLYVHPEQGLTAATFDLSQPPSSDPSGMCTIGSDTLYDREVTLFSSGGQLLVNNTDPAQLEQLVLDDAGACSERHELGVDSRSYALQALEHGKLLALGAEALFLYDTTEPGLLARADLAARFTASAPSALQLLPSRTVQQLAAVLYTGSDYRAQYQLLTFDNATLFAHAVLDARGTPQQLAQLESSLAAVSSSELRMFDAHNLDAPRALGRLELVERYNALFALGDHVVRIRQHPIVLPPGERGRSVQDDLEVLAGGELVASLPVESEGQWFQVGGRLVNAQLSIAEYGSETERKALVALQVYDLSDPTAPRKAGAVSTTEVEAEWTPGHFYEPFVSYLVVGDALVIPQRKRDPSVHVRQCWKTVDYDACKEQSDPNCEDRYTGTLVCRAIDQEPEVCTVYDLEHCTADGCESLSELPDGVPSSLDGCNELTEPGRMTTFAFNVFDLRDPDQPTLIRPVYALPDSLLSHEYFVSGSKLYVTELDGDALFASELDLSDPTAPQLSARQAVTGRVVAAVEEDLYVGPQADIQTEFALTRVRCCGDSQPSASRSWTERAFGSLRSDGAGHLLLVHAPAVAAQFNWTRLEVLDSQTLATLAALDIDTLAKALQAPSNGRLVAVGPGALYLVDVRDAQAPRLQAALPYSTGPVALQPDQLIVADELGYRTYSLELGNMLP